MPGYPVSQSDLDMNVGANVVALRDALDQARTINDWLNLHPSDAPGGDLLTKPIEEGGFGYSADDAYAMRLMYEGIVAIDVTQLSELGKNFTGLH